MSDIMDKLKSKLSDDEYKEVSRMILNMKVEIHRLKSEYEPYTNDEIEKAFGSETVNPMAVFSIGSREFKPQKL